jgi:Domain of unknown function (DUF3806)
MEQQISELNDSEKGWLADQLRAARAFVESFSPGHGSQEPTLSVLDRAFAAWLATDPTDVDLINRNINAVGIAFGRALVEGLGMRWVIAQDEAGTDLAVFGFPGRGDVLIYPANFVAKRWERREVHFLEDSYRRIKDDVNQLLESYESGPKQ